jgi:hypothetical protein
MSKNELLTRERLSATGARVSKSETAQTTRVLRDDELDAVSGGWTWGLSQSGTGH